MSYEEKIRFEIMLLRGALAFDDHAYYERDLHRTRLMALIRESHEMELSRIGDLSCSDGIKGALCCFSVGLCYLRAAVTRKPPLYDDIIRGMIPYDEELLFSLSALPSGPVR